MIGSPKCVVNQPFKSHCTFRAQVPCYCRDPDCSKNIPEAVSDQFCHSCCVRYFGRDCASCGASCEPGGPCYRKFCGCTAIENPHYLCLRCSGKGRTALHLAARRGDVSKIVLLLDGGADPNAEDSFGWTPWDWAYTCQRDVQDLLQEHGAIPMMVLQIEVNQHTENGQVEIAARTIGGDCVASESFPKIVSVGEVLSALKSKGCRPATLLVGDLSLGQDAAAEPLMDFVSFDGAELRKARDSQSYTFMDFIEYYGAHRGLIEWRYANAAA